MYDRVLKSMIETGSLFHMLMTLSIENNDLILQEL